MPRKNQLIRPKVANLDQIVVVLAKTPKPDFMLVDKLIVYAKKIGLEVLLVINKSDLAKNEFLLDITNQYFKTAETIIEMSAINDFSFNELHIALEGKFSVFAGQSAVGKSTILNALNPELNLETDVLSRKTERGRHTEIFDLGGDTFVADTPGFSLLDLGDINPSKLAEYYPDFDQYKSECKYRMCTHVNEAENECGVKRALHTNEVNNERYNRYVELYNSIKEKWDKKYD